MRFLPWIVIAAASALIALCVVVGLIERIL
jgi:hypothetical protein